MKLENKIEQVVAIFPPGLQQEFALWRYSKTEWIAAIGGTTHVALGEYPGDYEARGETPYQALDNLIFKIVIG